MLDYQGAKIGSMIKIKNRNNAKGLVCPFALASKMVDIFSTSSLNVRGGGRRFSHSNAPHDFIFSKVCP